MDTYKLKMPKPLMIAHRGLSGMERENTCAAFVAAGNRSYYGIETDVHLTVDGKYIVIHDDTTERVTGKELTVEETTFDELRKLQLFDLETESPRVDLHLPSLDEYISICKKYEKIAVLELKNPMPAEKVEEIAQAVAEQGYIENTVFISFSLDNLITLKSKYPNQPAQYLLKETGDMDELIQLLMKYDLDLDIKYTALTEEKVAKLHENGIKVNVWTVNTPEDAERMIQMGVDYITTNILE